jgi:hypothetical protein
MEQPIFSVFESPTASRLLCVIAGSGRFILGERAALALLTILDPRLGADQVQLIVPQ